MTVAGEGMIYNDLWELISSYAQDRDIWKQHNAIKLIGEYASNLPQPMATELLIDTCADLFDPTDFEMGGQEMVSAASKLYSWVRRKGLVEEKQAVRMMLEDWLDRLQKADAYPWVEFVREGLILMTDHPASEISSHKQSTKSTTAILGQGAFVGLDIDMEKNDSNSILSNLRNVQVDIEQEDSNSILVNLRNDFNLLKFRFDMIHSSLEQEIRHQVERTDDRLKSIHTRLDDLIGKKGIRISKVAVFLSILLFILGVVIQHYLGLIGTNQMP